MLMEEIFKYTDFELFRQLAMQSGQAEAAFAAIGETFKNVVVMYIKNYIRNDEELIKDVFTETMMVLWMQRMEAAQKEKPLSWLLKIAHNIAVDKIKLQKKYYTEPLEQHFSSLADDDHAAGETERKALEALFRKAMDRLPPQERNVLLLSRIEELSNKEIALRYKVSVQTIKNQLSRALKKIRRYMRDALNSIFI
ncbi:sigma-70 family RNA polymerase sigma factor [Terrimonas sp.]|nr:sigma-70 family RNA polymerase sigma factor [Terrimonas sp.]